MDAGSKDGQPPAHPTPGQTLDFLSIAQNLKLNKRMGWIRCGVDKLQTESIADHMYRMALMGLTATSTNLDTNKLLRLAIVHDIAEVGTYYALALVLRDVSFHNLCCIVDGAVR